MRIKRPDSLNTGASAVENCDNPLDIISTECEADRLCAITGLETRRTEDRVGKSVIARNHARGPDLDGLPVPMFRAAYVRATNKLESLSASAPNVQQRFVVIATRKRAGDGLLQL